MINDCKQLRVTDRPLWSSPHPCMASLQRNGDGAAGAVKSFPNQFIFAVGQRGYRRRVSPKTTPVCPPVS